MDFKYIDRQLRAHRRESRGISSFNGRTPIHFDETNFDDVSREFPTIVNVCTRMWTFFGYTGLITPWHEQGALDTLRFQKNNLQKWYYKLTEMDVSVESYCIICCSISNYVKYDRPGTLLIQNACMSWVKKLRKHAGSRELVDKVARFIEHFVELQIEHTNRAARITAGSVIKPDTNNMSSSGKPTKFLDSYHRIADRIRQFESLGVDYEYWIKRKFDRCLDTIGAEKLYLNTIVNVNGLDPDLSELNQEASDPWREIREFLGLPQECEFPDGFIPKGWNISSNNSDDSKDVVRVMGDGFYFYKDGSQRRGKRHYASNRYFIIKCDYSNFQYFKDRWLEARLLSAKPTWEEYSQWALFPDVWNELGESLIYTKDVKWRKK
jgi:hypothetical protein